MLARKYKEYAVKSAQSSRIRLNALIEFKVREIENLRIKARMGSEILFSEYKTKRIKHFNFKS